MSLEPDTTADPTAVDDLTIVRLLTAGYEPTTLSQTLGLDLDRVLALMPLERQRTVAADAALAEAMRVLAWRTVEEALMILDEGSQDMKMRLISKFGGDMARVLSKHDKDELHDMREDFRNLMAAVRGDES